MTRPQSIWLGIALTLFAVDNVVTGGQDWITAIDIAFAVANIIIGLRPDIDEDY